MFRPRRRKGVEGGDAGLFIAGLALQGKLGFDVGEAMDDGEASG
jgi:hypothetical protein